jgi:hypothetical protein
MTITLTDPGPLVMIDGVPCRQWVGTRGDDGHALFVFVHRIAVPDGADQAEYRAALIETRSPDITSAIAETADWIEDRASILERIASQANRKVAELLKVEAARFRGRAALVRLADRLPQTQPSAEGGGQ